MTISASFSSVLLCAEEILSLYFLLSLNFKKSLLDKLHSQVKEFGGVVPELAARSHIEKIDSHGCF